MAGHVAALAADPIGGLFVADFGHNRVLHFGGTSTAADRVYGQKGNFQGFLPLAGEAQPSAATLVRPLGVAVDLSGGLYIADTGTHRVLHFGGTSTTADRVYGQGGRFDAFRSGADASPSATNMNAPRGVAADPSGGLYVADTDNCRVLHFSATSTTADRVYG